MTPTTAFDQAWSDLSCSNPTQHTASVSSRSYALRLEKQRKLQQQKRKEQLPTCEKIQASNNTTRAKTPKHEKASIENIIQQRKHTKLKISLQQAPRSCPAIQTERTERQEQQRLEQIHNTTNPHEPLKPLVPKFPTKSDPHDPEDGDLYTKAHRPLYEPPSPKRVLGNSKSKSRLAREQHQRVLEWMDKQAQFAHRIAILERDRTNFFAKKGTSLSFASHSRQIRSELIETANALDEQRNFELKVIHQKHLKFQRQVRQFKHDIHQMELGNTGKYLETFAASINEFETQFQHFQSSLQQQLIEYEREEAACTEELTRFQQLMSRWDTKVVQHYEQPTRATQHKAQLSASGDTSFPAAEVPVSDTKVSDCSRRIAKLNTQIHQHQHAHQHNSSYPWTESQEDHLLKFVRQYGYSDEYLSENYVKLGKCFDHLLTFDRANEIMETRELIEHFQEQSEDSTTTHLVVKVLKLFQTLRVVHFPMKTIFHFISVFRYWLKLLKMQTQKKQIIQSWKIEQSKAKATAVEAATEGGTKDDDLYHNVEKAKEQAQLRKQEEMRKQKKQAIEQWHMEKERKAAEESENKRLSQAKSAAKQAAIHQKQAEVKRQVSQYQARRQLKQQQEQEQLERIRATKKLRHNVSNRKLLEKSNQAIEQAIEKRERIQEYQKQKKGIQDAKVALAKPTKQAILLSKKLASQPSSLTKDTSATKARELTSEQRAARDIERQHKNAHDGYYQGKEAKHLAHGKSFGHVPLQPRQTPQWRKGL